MPFDLGQLLSPTLDRDPTRVAVVRGDVQLTYAELEAACLAASREFVMHGLRQGDRIVLRRQSGLDMLVGVLAAWKAHLVPVPVYSSYPEDVSTRLAIRTEAAGEWLDASRGQAELRQRLTSQEAHEEGRGLALIVPTSGTTAPPKAVALSRRGMAWQTSTLGSLLSVGADDVGLAHEASLTRSMALNWLVLPLLRAGGCLKIPVGSGAIDGWRAWRSGPATSLVLLNPRGLAETLDYPLQAADCEQLRFIGCGADVAPEVLRRRTVRATGRRLTVLYGLTEAGGCLFDREAPHDAARSLGVPVPGVETRVVDEAGLSAKQGELWIRSPGQMVGYWRPSTDELITTEEGWIRTGDVVARDEDGRFTYLSRAKDIITLGGLKVSPAMVEAALESHPSVLRAVVVGAPSSSVGECVRAWVQVAREAPPIQVADLVEWLRSRIESIAIPTEWGRTDDWHLTPAGKLDRSALRLRALDGRWHS